MAEQKTRRLERYLVLRKASERRWDNRNKAVLVRDTPNRPDLKQGECAVRITIDVPEEAFEPVLSVPAQTFTVAEVLRAGITKEKP